jgi:hypothetical protein
MARAYPFASRHGRHCITPVGSSVCVPLVAEATSPQVVALGIELSAAALSGPLGQPALDYRVGCRLSAFGQRLASAIRPLTADSH